MDKRALIDQLLSDLQREVDVLLVAARDAREAATHEESRAENEKDTRAIEAGYLAGAQATRVQELRAAANALASLPLHTFAPEETVRASALVATVTAGMRVWFFLAPAGGGMRVSEAGESVQVVTPRSPIGAALLGRAVGDVIEAQAHGAPREYQIVAIV